MSIVFLTSFVIGLLLAVRAMLHGIERPAKTTRSPRPGTDTAPAPPRFVINLPTTAGFATGFGATGYLLARYTTLSRVPGVLIALVAGAAGAAAALTLVAAWAIPAAKAEVVDERYLLQGAPARVLSIAGGGSSGTIEYQNDGATLTARAAGLDGVLLVAGSEVVIERIEDGIAYVEPWDRVEARL
jgi:apolipoprotein N-acyltransferase